MKPHGYCEKHLESTGKLKKKSKIVPIVEGQAITYGERTVYFIQAKSGGPIKIGVTQLGKAKTRLSSVQASSPEELVLLAAVNCREWLESELHALFDKDLVRGEWFSPTPRLLEIIECAKKGVDHVILNLRKEYTL